MERKVGARGLRMILEDLMLDLMYYLPSYKKVREFLVTKEMVHVAEDQHGVARKGGLDRFRRETNTLDSAAVSGVRSCCRSPVPCFGTQIAWKIHRW